MTRSFTENGTPWSGPSVALRRDTARSAALARRRASSPVRVTKALMAGLTFSMRVSTASITSTGEIFFFLIRPASSVADIQQSALFAFAMTDPPRHLAAGQVFRAAEVRASRRASLVPAPWKFAAGAVKVARQDRGVRFAPRQCVSGCRPGRSEALRARRPVPRQPPFGKIGRWTHATVYIAPRIRGRRARNAPLRPGRRLRRRRSEVATLAAAQARIERVTERVPEQVRAEHGEADRQPREEHEPGGLLRVLGRRHRQHATPRRVRLGHAHAEERERGLHEDGAPELRRGEDDERPDRVRQDVAEGDPEVADADRAGGLHVLHLADREHARANDARGARNDRDRDRDDDVVDRGAEG